MSTHNHREICFLRMNRAGAGGAENYLARLSAELKRTGYSHRIIHTRLPRKLLSWIRILLYVSSVCMTKRRRFYFSLERIGCADIYRAGDGVHKAYLKIKGKSLNPLHPITLWLERRCFNNAKHIIANSKMVCRQIIQHYKIAPKKISVVYSGIDLNTEKPNGQAIRDEFGISPNDKIILYVGSGFERKGVAELLHLLPKLNVNYWALIVGHDKRFTHYQDLAKQNGIESKVIFTGERRDVDRIYAAADIVLLPTRYEPFSNVALEAMRFDNAIITTRQNGAAEILDETFVMEHSKDQSILATLKRLLIDDAWLQEVKRNNLKKVRDFSIERNTAQTLKLIHQVMKEK